MNNYEFKVSKLGKGKIIENGIDISSELVGFEVHCHSGKPTRVVLHRLGEVTGEVEAE